MCYGLDYGHDLFNPCNEYLFVRTAGPCIANVVTFSVSSEDKVHVVTARNLEGRHEHVG